MMYYQKKVGGIIAKNVQKISRLNVQVQRDGTKHNRKLPRQENQ